MRTYIRTGVLSAVGIKFMLTICTSVFTLGVDMKHLLFLLATDLLPAIVIGAFAGRLVWKFGLTRTLLAVIAIASISTVCAWVTVLFVFQLLDADRRIAFNLAVAVIQSFSGLVFELLIVGILLGRRHFTNNGGKEVT